MGTVGCRILTHSEQAPFALLELSKDLAVAAAVRAVSAAGLHNLEAIRKTGTLDFGWLYEKLSASSYRICG